MDRDRGDEEDDDDIQERLLNRNRRKRNREEEEEQNAFTFEDALRQAVLMSTSQAVTVNSLAVNPALSASRGFPDLTTVGMQPNAAASSPFRGQQTMLYGRGSQLPGINLGYSEAAGSSPFLLPQQQQQLQLLQRQQQEERLMQQLAAARGFTNYGTPLAGSLLMNNPTGLLGVASAGALPPFATSSTDPLVHRSYPSELQRQMLPNSTMQSQSGLGSASSTTQSLGGVGVAHHPIASGQDRSSPKPRQQRRPPQSPPPSSLPSPPPLDEIDLFRTADLYMPADDDVLSENQILVRKQTEFFVAQQSDIDNFTPGRRKELSVGQVGIRCRHCAELPPSERPRGAVYFPSTLRALYQAGQNMASIHFSETCKTMDPDVKALLIEMQQKKPVMGHGGKNYWAEGAMTLGVYETNRGLRFRVQGPRSSTIQVEFDKTKVVVV